ncbi:MAG: cytochrome C oxidase subunit I, partial [Bacteroidetes Order II. Incertae sedis bacterium]|nr:cytochrome C oxidase subunit I [Bacteroidetes Order II. bacterium]
MSNFLPGRSRQCGTTGLPVCLDAAFFIKANAVFAVVSLLIGGIGAILLGLTRWSAVHLLSDVMYYRILTLHGIDMLIFWILFFEVAVIYFAVTSPLNSRLFSRKIAWVSLVLMVIGAVLTNVMILQGKGDVLMTSYPPLMADPMFYLGIILVAVGVLVALYNFFATIYIANRDKTYEGSMPLVTFGALAASIIAVFTLLHGATALIPTFTWSMGWTPEPDAGWYRLVWWALGHPAQQVNLCAMVAIWYFLGTVTTGAKPLNETVSRGAFLLYILFINLASAHHLLVDPGLGATWKIWNTSYAMYLAVLASLVHGFTVPAGIEVAQRMKGHGKGIFTWLVKAPWKDPGFSSVVLSALIFGFMGGITGVTIGTEQINIIAHNTLRIPGHFHVTVVGGTTLAFMGLTYYVVPLIFQKEFYTKSLLRIQPFVFGAGIVIMSVGMSFAGSYGVPRRHWDVEFAGAVLPAGFDSAAHFMLGVLGIGSVIAFIGLLMFILPTVIAVFF